MSKYYNCCFVSNTVFDNGKIDSNEHPAIIIGNIILYNNHTESEPMSFDMVHYPTLPCDGETILPFFVEKDREIIKKRLDWDRKHRPCLPYYERKYEEVTDKVYDLLVKEKK